MMEAIRNWLNGDRDYQAGIQLYAAYGNNATLKRVLASEGQTSFKESKLLEALRQIWHQHKTPQTEKARAIQAVVSAPAVQSKGWPSQPIEDPVLRSLWEQWNPLYKEMLSLQQRLYAVSAAGLQDHNQQLAAGQMAHRILDLDDQVESIYASRNHYQQNGHLPHTQSKSEHIVDPVRWATQLKNAERYVREYKVKMNKAPNSPLMATWADKLKAFEADVIKYKKLLKLD